MTRREEVLRTATELLAAKLGKHLPGGETTQKEACVEAVRLAEFLVAEVDRRHPEAGTQRGGPDDR